jgi:polyphosphate kinase
VGEDLTDLFNHLTGYGRPVTYRRIVVAPQGMRPWILSQIAEQAAVGESGRITIKVNGLTDPEVIDALYAASSAGVKIDLIVRGICCLRPGVPGLSDRITVRSIMGRFLEHSRIFRFGEPGGDRPVRYTMGSGDLMERNLDRRIEVLVPVLDPKLQARLEETIQLSLADDTNAWILGPDGDWVRAVPVLGLSSQKRLQELALERARRRRSPEKLS